MSDTGTSTVAVTAPATEPGDLARVRWSTPIVIGLAALAGLSYGWGASHGSLELYYEAAVRSMSASWHDFLFGAFDPAGTISVDKLPGALWVQALSVRLFGFHEWAIVLPQVVEGVLTVLVLYRAVWRLAGQVAGLVAAAVVVITPATVALDRGNIADSLLILLLVAAANSTVTALRTGQWRWVALAGFWVGLAFQAKMLEAWLVLPALMLVWLVGAPGRPLRRALPVAVALAVTVVVSLSWMTAVSLVPQSQRPHVDGSTHDSLFAQVFIYNGFGRNDSATPLPSAQNTAFTALVDFRLPGAKGPTRLLRGAGGRDVGWLIPLALLGGLAALVARRRRCRGDPLRLAALLWGVWLVTYLGAFSVLSGINAYYLAALTPAIGALCGIGVELVRRTSWSARRVLGLALAAVAVTVLYADWLSGPAPTAVRLVVLLLPLGLLGAATALLVGAPRPGGWTGRAAIAVVLAGTALALGSAAATTDIVVTGLGPFDTPYQPAAVTHITQVEPALALSSLRTGLPLLLTANRGHRFTSAAYTSIIAAPLIIDTGREIEPIGGFRGSNPWPSVAQLRQQVERRQLQTIIAPAIDDPRLSWVRHHCVLVPSTTGVKQGGPISGVHIYFCAPQQPAG